MLFDPTARAAVGQLDTAGTWGWCCCGATPGWHTDRMTRRSVLVSLSVGAISAVLIAFITGDRPLEALAGGLVVASLGAAIAR